MNAVKTDNVTRLRSLLFYGSSEEITRSILPILPLPPNPEMWHRQAELTLRALLGVLCDLRDQGKTELTLSVMRENLFLGIGLDKATLSGAMPMTVADVPAKAWQEIRGRKGHIELFLRAMHGEVSQAALLDSKSLFDSLSGFSISRALTGERQELTVIEPYGFTSVMISKQLGEIADALGE